MNRMAASRRSKYFRPTVFHLENRTTPSVVLSDNMAKTSSGVESATGSNWLTASFGTGAAPHVLSSVSLLMANPVAGSATLSLYGDGSLEPGSLIADLTSPASYMTSLAANTFTSISGVNLTANTTYWVVLKANSGQFDWSWTADNTGSGVGFQHVWGSSADAGATWFTINLFPTQMAVTADVPAHATNFVINGGDLQRSRVTSVEVSFDRVATFVGSPSAAFQLERQSDDATVNVLATPNGNNTSFTLTFTGGAVDGVAGNLSLADGRYTLTLLANQFAGTGFDGDTDGTAEGSPTDNYSYASATTGTPTNIFRLFGDITGDGSVAINDFNLFRFAFGGTNDAFDFDGDGSVAISDFNVFRDQFGNSI